MSEDSLTLYKSLDRRPLFQHYIRLLPACSSDFLQGILREKSSVFHPFINSEFLQRAPHHSALVCEYAMSSVLDSSMSGFSVLQVLPFLCQKNQVGFPIEVDCSVSMSFSLALLRKLSVHGCVKIQADYLMNNLIQPLLRRAYKRNMGTNRLREIIALSVSYLKAHPQGLYRLHMEEPIFFHFLVRCWQTDIQSFEQPLLEFLASGASVPSAARDIIEMLLLVHRIHRYKLLQLILSHAKENPRDINKISDLERVQFSWPHQLFTCLQVDHALRLLKALIQAKPERNFLTQDITRTNRQTIFALGVDPNSSHGDPQLLQLLLLRGTEGSVDVAQIGTVT